MTRTATTHASKRATATRSPVHLLDRGRLKLTSTSWWTAPSWRRRAIGTQPPPYGEFAVWNLHMDHPEMTILWDRGSQRDAVDGYWPTPLFEAPAHHDAAYRDLDAALEEHGYRLEDVDAVVMSHLHLDRAGGLHPVIETEVPVYVHACELQFGSSSSAQTTEGWVADWAADFDHERNWQVAHDDHTLVVGIELLRSHGHTAGLLGAELETAERTSLVVGDEAYMPATDHAGVSMAASLLWGNQA